MDTTRLRGRFLIAMGLVEAACSRENAHPETTTPVGSTSAQMTASATPSGTPSAIPSGTDSAATTASATPTATPSATASGAASVAATPPGSVPKPTPFGPGYSCGFDVVCKPAKGKCAATYTETKAEAGSNPPRTGDLYPEAPQNQAGQCCYKLGRRFCGGGRPLRDASDDPIVASIVGGAISDDPIAARWLREATFEHASVASFARVSLQLLALGAPPELLEATNRAALDEIEHTGTFLALAKRRGGAEHRIGPLAVERAPVVATFEAFAVETFLDGCVAETISGIEIRSCADDGDDFERRAVAAIADDEERHAELAWRMLAWALRAGGPRTRVALEEAIGRIDRNHPVVRDVVLPCVAALTKVVPDGERSCIPRA
jgi:hypothetical protein